MNRELFRLAAQGLKRKRKSSMLLFAVLCLSFAFAVVSLSVTSSMEATNQNFRLETYGKWQGAIAEGRQEDEKFFGQQDWLLSLGISRQAGTLIGKKGSITFGTVDAAFMELGNLGLQDGRWPENPSEIVMEANSLSSLGYDYELGQELTLTASLPAFGAPGNMVTIEHTYTLCGVVRAYTSLWQFSGMMSAGSYLNSAIVTEETVELLRQEGEKEAQELEDQARETIDQLKAEGEEIDPSLTSQLNILLEDPAPLYIFTSKEGMEQQMREAVDQYLASFEEKRLSMSENTGAHGSWQKQEQSFHYFYAILVFAMMIFAILCIYALQLPKQVRQIALFRSIGIKKSQLRSLALYENLILCLPALTLGAGLGALGTLGALRLLFYSGSAPIAVSLPWALLGILAAAWMLGVFLARLIILQIALREPLTGRIAMGNKKAKRVKRAQNALVGALASLLCGVLIFTVLEILEPMDWITESRDWSSYSIYCGNLSPDFYTQESPVYPNMISPEWRALTETVPGVSDSSAHVYLVAELRFEGMEDSDYYQGEREAQEIDHKWNEGRGDPDYSPDALGVNVCALSDEELARYVDLEELGVDPEAFRRGEEVIVSLKTDVDGSYLGFMPIVESSNQSGYSSNRRHYKNPVLKTGDTVELNIFGRKLGDFGELSNEEEITSLHTFSPKAAVITQYAYDPDLDVLLDPYDVLCSYEYLERAFSQMEPGYRSYNYIIGGEFGFADLFLRTDRDAGYLATDAVIASLCVEKGFRLDNYRESNAAIIQEKAQTVILLAASGGCIALILLLILSNTFSLEREREKRGYGVLQALGLSKVQMRKKLLKTAVLRGVLGAAAGWLLFGVFLLADTPRLLAKEADWTRQYGAVPAYTTVWQAFLESIHRLQMSGAGLWLVLALTSAGILLVVCLSLFSKRQLFRGDLMEKLRDEQ